MVPCYALRGTESAGHVRGIVTGRLKEAAERHERDANAFVEERKRFESALDTATSAYKKVTRSYHAPHTKF